MCRYFYAAWTTVAPSSVVEVRPGTLSCLANVPYLVNAVRTRSGVSNNMFQSYCYIVLWICIYTYIYMWYRIPGMDLNTIQNDLGNHLGPYRTDVSVCFVAYGPGSS